MKSKCLLVLMALFYCISMNAEEQEIVLYEQGVEDEVGFDKRSINLGPTATIDEGLLRIDTNVSVAYVRVVIKDNNGNVVYSGSDGTTARSHQFAMGNLPEGCCTLEVRIGDRAYYGEFVN